MELNIKELKNIFKDKVRTVYIVCIALLCLFAYVLLFQFDVSNISKIEKRKNELLINIQKAVEIKKYKEKIAEFNKKQKKDKKGNWFFEMVTEQAKKNNIVIDYMEPLGTFNEAGYKTTRIFVEGKSRYFDLVDFILELEKDESYIYAEDIKLQAVNPDSLSIYKIKGLYKSNQKPTRDIFDKGELMASFKLTVANLSKA